MNQRESDFKGFAIFTDGYLNWFITKDQLDNKVGKWYMALGKLEDSINVTEYLTRQDSCQMIEKEDLSWNFQIDQYSAHIYSGGAYYFDEKNEQWSGNGVKVIYH